MLERCARRRLRTFKHPKRHGLPQPALLALRTLTQRTCARTYDNECVNQRCVRTCVRTYVPVFLYVRRRILRAYVRAYAPKISSGRLKDPQRRFNSGRAARAIDSWKANLTRIVARADAHAAQRVSLVQPSSQALSWWHVHTNIVSQESPLLLRALPRARRAR
jgi:hypothetical protein